MAAMLIEQILLTGFKHATVSDDVKMELYSRIIEVPSIKLKPGDASLAQLVLLQVHWREGGYSYFRYLLV